MYCVYRAKFLILIFQRTKGEFVEDKENNEALSAHVGNNKFILKFWLTSFCDKMKDEN